jgi:hypothetical protein
MEYLAGELVLSCYYGVKGIGWDVKIMTIPEFKNNDMGGVRIHAKAGVESLRITN